MWSWLTHLLVATYLSQLLFCKSRSRFQWRPHLYIWTHAGNKAYTKTTDEVEIWGNCWKDIWIVTGGLPLIYTRLVWPITPMTAKRTWLLGSYNPSHNEKYTKEGFHFFQTAQINRDPRLQTIFNVRTQHWGRLLDYVALTSKTFYNTLANITDGISVGNSR